MICRRASFATFVAIAVSAPTRAAVTISTAATQNMSCSSGTCMPTAAKAVLNVSDLENDLSQFGNVRVMTTGSGVEAASIVVTAAFSSPDSTSLTLEAHEAITINRAVSIGSGTAELELQSDTLDATDALSFGRKGHITFGSLSDIFGINGRIFTLVGSVQGLANAVAANPSGAIALANSYDASQDGTYTLPPVQTLFSGVFEGLGNTIKYLSITSAGAALFEWIDGGTVADIGLVRVAISDDSDFDSDSSGALAAINDGTIIHAYSTGRVKARSGYVGGLVGINGATINDSYSTVPVVSGKAWAGGLVGINQGPVNDSFATGSVTLKNSGGEQERNIGGLVGANDSGGSIANSYATGPVAGGYCGGGLIGRSLYGDTSDSYSTGLVVAGVYGGGFMGCNYSGGISNGYWDTTTSETETGVGYGFDSGVTGLTTEQLQSGLPNGFDPKIWAEDSNINNGLPYLINNPPSN